ncbi:MAG TPA: SBBP repeat-containing protein, partial [Chitinophagales bacterium]|nr:SBBP repeat-containing protein [Chitinophagales bacterium]
DVGKAIAVDASGNIYTTGYFTATGDFDPGAGVFNLTAEGTSPTSRDIFISKVDPAGNFIWAKRIGGIAGPDIANGMCIDNSDNLYLTGYFQGTVDFDPGTGVFNVDAVGTEDIFVCKLDSSGNLVWVKTMGGVGTTGNDISHGNAIAIDSSANVYVTGYFGSTVDFDPNGGVFNLTSSSAQNVFISKLNSDGDFIWARQIEGAGYGNGNDIALDAAGNVYTTGNFYGIADFNPGTSVSNLNGGAYWDVFISKLDASGNYVWARQFTGATSNDFGFSIDVDAVGNVYTTGRFAATVDFNPGGSTYDLTASGTNDIFVSKLNAAGNFSWARQLGGTSIDGGNAIAVDSVSVYTTGYFSNTADFDPGPGTFDLTGGTASDIFLTKWDSAANFVWAGNMGSTYSDVGYNVVMDKAGGVYTTGHFEFTADFDPGPGVYNLSTPNGAGSGAVFLQKVSNGSVILPIELLNFSGTHYSGKNILVWATAAEINNDFFTLEKSRDAKTFRPIAHMKGAGNSIALLNYSFTDDHPDVVSDVFYYRLRQTDYDGRTAYSKIIALNSNVLVESEFMIWPNPAHDKFTVHFPSDIRFDLSVTDVTGRKVYEQQNADARTTIDCSGFPNGMYYVRISNGEKRILSTQKFIRQ